MNHDGANAITNHGMALMKKNITAENNGFKINNNVQGWLKSWLKVAYYSFIRVQEVYTTNEQIQLIFLHQYSDNK